MIFSTESWSTVSLDKDAPRSKQLRCINLQNDSIPRLLRQFSSFSVCGTSQDSRSSVANEEEIVDVGDDSDESTFLQPSFKPPSEEFQAAHEEVLQTSECLSHSTNPLGTEPFVLSPS